VWRTPCRRRGHPWAILSIHVQCHAVVGNGTGLGQCAAGANGVGRTCPVRRVLVLRAPAFSAGWLHALNGMFGDPAGACHGNLAVCPLGHVPRGTWPPTAFLSSPSRQAWPSSDEPHGSRLLDHLDLPSRGDRSVAPTRSEGQRGRWARADPATQMLLLSNPRRGKSQPRSWLGPNWQLAASESVTNREEL
jgi:hypothetical protein